MGLYSNQQVLITGTNRGIGKAMCEAFAKEGANIISCNRTIDDAYLNFSKTLEDKYTVSIKNYSIDLSDETLLKATLRQVIKDNPTIHVLVNNAAVAFNGTFFMTSSQKLAEVFKVNFFSQITIMQTIARLMQKQKFGSIINMASVGAIEANPGYLAYGSSKAALIYATRVLSKEIAPFNVRVNAIAPGLTDTMMGHTKNEVEIEKVLSRTPLKRMATVDEIADLAVFLGSDKASYITGQIIKVDGGRCS